jgi:hypothetical protein
MDFFIFKNKRFGTAVGTIGKEYMSEINKGKSLIDFLEVLKSLTQDNINHIQGFEGFEPKINNKIFKYDIELMAVQNLINSFDFHDED